MDSSRVMDDLRAGVCFFKPHYSANIAQMLFGLQLPGMPPEEFRDIAFENVARDRYFITSYGRIFKKDGTELFPREYKSHYKTYLSIELSIYPYCGAKMKKAFFVHRLVAGMFIPKTKEDYENKRDFVNHKYNMDGHCNFPWNLEWVNNGENMLHSYQREDGVSDTAYYDPVLFDTTFLENRRKSMNHVNLGVTSSSVSISDYQVHLICYAYTVLGYTVWQAAEYAWLNPKNQNEYMIASSIIRGYSWREIGQQYGIAPKWKKQKRKKDKRPILEDPFIPNPVF